MVTAGALLAVASGCTAAHEPEAEYDERRLRVVMDRPESGEPTFVGFYDPVLDVLCEPRETEDGVLRCVPSVMGGAPNYADPHCTEPIDTIVDPYRFRYLVETVWRDACPASSYVRVFEISEEPESFSDLLSLVRHRGV